MINPKMIRKRFQNPRRKLQGRAKEGSRRTTIFDVARLAGVSISTVSRVLNESAGVKPELQQRVLDAVQKLEYYPNYVARGLATRSTRTVGLIITDITNPFFTELVHGAEGAANSRGYNLLFCNTDESAEKEARYMQILRNHLVAGIIISATRMNDEHLIELKRDKIPFVLINRYLEGTDTPCVRTDFSLGAQQATFHLIEKGHRKILLLNGPSASQGARFRQDGYIGAFAEHGLPFDPQLIRSYRPTIEGGYKGLIEALDHGPEFTALLAYNDLMAVGALDALQDRRIKVPEEIAVVSFDDTILASHTRPPLTAVRQDKELLGKAAMEMLIDIVEGKELITRDMVLEPVLVVRESSRGASPEELG